MIVRILAFSIAVPLLVLGGYGIARARVPSHDAVGALEERLADVASLAGQGIHEVREAVESPPVHFGLAGFGLLALFVSLRPGRKSGGEEPASGSAPLSDAGAPASPDRSSRKFVRQAAQIAKKGDPIEAAEMCFSVGALDAAANYFVAGGEFVRAAEVRHDQNQFELAADLYLQAGQHETAATIFASQGAFDRAAECYEKAELMTVAAEMYEKAERYQQAGDCYARCEFHRQAAQAFLKAENWVAAARSLEAVVAEETTRVGSGQSPEAEKEIRLMVLRAGKLYEEAGDLESAERILEQGGCAAAAAEVALQLEHFAKAAELFEQAGEPERAAEVLRQIGETEAAARILGEHLRERGSPEDAARHLLEAGDFMSAGDLYRSLERFGEAGECYEKIGDAGQAAEMYQLAQDFRRAAECHSKAGEHDQAAECWGQLGEVGLQGEALGQAGRHVDAGRLFLDSKREEDAIRVLQLVPADSYDFAAASAMLGEIFQGRGQHKLAVAKLEQALGGAEISRENVDAYYRLASVQEQSGEDEQAAAVYERILAFDYHYGDVETRLAGARARAEAAAREAARIQEESASPPSRVGGDATAVPAAAKPARYQIVGELGRGGMGIVYQAQDTVLDRPVAFKVLPDALRENPQALANFLREAKSAAKLNHPNIVTVYDAGEQEGRFYIAMEYVDGTTLKQIVQRRGAIAPSGVLHVLLQMCEALGYAHEHKVVHRDIKTANTMWTREKQAKIMDFGLAKVVEEVRNHTTLVSGTPYYMSPEQTLGKNIDHRTDIYSLGVTVFELATGTLPFREGNVPYHHVHTPPPDPREVNPKCPGLLAGIINKCLQKAPDARYSTTREISAQVKAVLARRSSGAS
ncbi:MAG: protein kinase [Myxococcales bacterium]|nr:protein kinase [Myxococcales bacterium]